MSKSKFYGDILLFVVAFIWGGGFVAGKFAMDTLSPSAVLMYRFIMASAAIGLVFFGKVRHSNRAEMKYGAILGVIFAISLFIQLTGLQYTTSSKQSFIAASYIMFTPIINQLFFHNRAKTRDIIAALLILTGVGFISLAKLEAIQIGDFITLGFAVVFSFQIIIVGRYTKELSAINVTFWQFVAAAVCSALAVFVTGDPAHIGSWNSFGGVTYLALLNTALAVALQNYAQKLTDENHAALILSLESVFGFALALIVLHEAVSLRIIFGGVLVFAGVIVSKVELNKC